LDLCLLRGHDDVRITGLGDFYNREIETKEGKSNFTASLNSTYLLPSKRAQASRLAAKQ
jgi:hypothetical protein